MIDTVKLQQAIVKDYIKNKANKWLTFINPIYEREYVAFKYGCYYLPYDDKIIDTSFLDPIKLEDMLDHVENSLPAEERRVEIVDKKKILTLYNEEVGEVYLNMDLLKYIKSYDEIRITKPKEPVFILERGIVLAMLLPINRKV